MSWFFEYRCNRSLKNHLCRLQYWIFDFAAYMQHYAKNTVSALNHSIILFILWKFVRLCIFGCLIQPEQVSLQKKFFSCRNAVFLQYFSVLQYMIFFASNKLQISGEGYFCMPNATRGGALLKKCSFGGKYCIFAVFDCFYSIRSLEL